MHDTDEHPRLLCGVDFSSAPSQRKPIVRAFGHRRGNAVRLSGLVEHRSLDALAEWLSQPGEWVGGFDLPFGLPRELVMALGWPQDWLGLMRLYRQLSRAEIRDRFSGFCAARPVGGKFAHRACDRPAGSSPSMKWVNPPVAYMLHAGIPLLLDAGVHLPGLHAGDPGRVALEAYPGLLARELVGHRSYKADDRRKQTPERQSARDILVTGLEQGRSRLGLRLVVDAGFRQHLIEEPQGDALDAVLCLMQTAWASAQPGWGLPTALDPLEGWILSAEHPAS